MGAKKASLISGAFLFVSRNSVDAILYACETDFVSVFVLYMPELVLIGVINCVGQRATF